MFFCSHSMYIMYQCSILVDRQVHTNVSTVHTLEQPKLRLILLLPVISIYVDVWHFADLMFTTDKW